MEEHKRALPLEDDGGQDAVVTPFTHVDSFQHRLLPLSIFSSESASTSTSTSSSSSSSPSDMEQEWRARQRQFQTFGYRDGVTEGKKLSAQEGFNAGFQEAAAAGFKWGVSRGFVSAFVALPACARETIVKDAVSRTRLEALNSTAASISATDALQLYYHELMASATPDKTHLSVSDDAISIEEPESSLNVNTKFKEVGNFCSTSGSDGFSSQYEAVRGEEVGSSLIQASQPVADVDDFNKQIPSEPAVNLESRHSSKHSPCIERSNAEDCQLHRDKSIAEASIVPIVDLSSHSHLNADSVSSFANMSISTSLSASVTSLHSLEDFRKAVWHEFELASLKCPITPHL